jgi:hypothetical protein
MDDTNIGSPSFLSNFPAPNFPASPAFQHFLLLRLASCVLGLSHISDFQADEDSALIA